MDVNIVILNIAKNQHEIFFGEHIVAHVLSFFDIHEESIPTLIINSSEISPAGRASNPT